MSRTKDPDYTVRLNNEQIIYDNGMESMVRKHRFTPTPAEELTASYSHTSAVDSMKLAIGN